MPQRVMNSRSDFFLPREKKRDAMESLLRIFGPAGAHARSLGAALALASFEITEDEEGNVDDLFLATESLAPEDTEALRAIAPFVRPGSYVMFIGEDAEQWAWVFRKDPATGETVAREEPVLPVLASDYNRLCAAAELAQKPPHRATASSSRGEDDPECEGP